MLQQWHKNRKVVGVGVAGFFWSSAATQKSHLLLFVGAQRIKQSQQWWRGVDLFKYLHLWFWLLGSPCPPPSPKAFDYFSSQPRSLSFLRLGKWRPRRQTGALHLVNPGGVWHKTNGSGSAVPASLHLARLERRRGAAASRDKQHADAGAEVDKFINDNNEDGEDDDNINN